MANDTDLPMPTPTIPNKPLPSFKTLSFDIYETLIQWESSIIQHLSPLLSSLPEDSPFKNAATTDPVARQALSNLFATHEKKLQSTFPTKSYPLILEQAYIRTANDVLLKSNNSHADHPGTTPDSHPDSDLDIETLAHTFGQSVGSWPAFPDTLSAMTRLSRHYRLIALSNVDRRSFHQTLSGPLAGIPFWRIFTAEDVGSYKPSHANFEYLFNHLERGHQDGDDDQKESGQGGQGTSTGASTSRFDNLHVAQSLHHDHVPCKALGVPSVWINRSGAGTGRSEFRQLHEKREVGYGWRFGTLQEFADEVDREYAL
ncbi:hypothetical protein RBB50_012549 [Rhinocladiella similis]